MQKTIFKVPKMDCPSEGQMIRMSLDGVIGLKKIEFDLSKREVTLYPRWQTGALFKNFSTTQSWLPNYFHQNDRF